MIARKSITNNRGVSVADMPISTRIIYGCSDVISFFIFHFSFLFIFREAESFPYNKQYYYIKKLYKNQAILPFRISFTLLLIANPFKYVIIFKK